MKDASQTRAMMAYAHQEMLDRGFPQLAGLVQEELDRNRWPMDGLLVGAAREFVR